MIELGNDKCWNILEELIINEVKIISSWLDFKKSDSWVGSYVVG